MASFAVGIGILLAWWISWTTYIQHLRRTAQLSRFSSSVYYALTAGFALVAAILAVARLAPFRFSQLGITQLGFLMAIATGLLLWAGQVAYLKMLRPVKRGAHPVVAAYPNHRPWFMPFVGAAEEIIFRGCLMYGLLALGMPTWVAALASAILFGLAHIFQYGWYGVFLNLITGMAFAAESLFATLGAAALGHFMYNVAVVAASTRRRAISQPVSRVDQA